jgi:hypothetical protein
MEKPQLQNQCSTSNPLRWLLYKPGGRDAEDNEIEVVIHKSQRGAIYLAKDEDLRWDEINDLGAHWHRSTAEAINLLTPVKSTIKNRTDRNRALKMLAAGLARALEERTADSDEDYLLKAREFIRARELEILRLWYFVAAFVTVVVITTIALGINTRSAGSLLREFSIAAICGGIGAMISVSERFRSIEVERYSSRRFIAVGASSRIFFGFIFGAAFLLFHKGGLLLNVANNQPFLLAAAALVAGFSERAIPEVLAQVEHQISTRKNSKTETSEIS